MSAAFTRGEVRTRVVNYEARVANGDEIPGEPGALSEREFGTVAHRAVNGEAQVSLVHTQVGRVARLSPVPGHGRGAVRPGASAASG